MATSRQDVVGSNCAKNSKTLTHKNSKTLTHDKTFNEMQLFNS